MPKTVPRLGAYAAALRYLETPPEIRRAVSPQTLAHYRRIKMRIPRALGEDLDRRGAPLYIVRWIGWARDDAERRARYRTAIETRDAAGRWPKSREIRSAGGRTLAAGAVNDVDRRVG